MATVLTTTYSTDTAITLDISSLATSSSFLAGLESGQVDNTTNKYDDVMLFVKPILGHASTAPTIGQQIRVYAWGSKESLATTAIDVLDGTSSAETLAHAGVLNSLRLIDAPTVTVATAGLYYPVMPVGLAQFFGGVVPPFWGLFIAHNHTGALAASQTALFSYMGITYTNT